MPARLAAAAATFAVLALPAAAHAKHVADHATKGPSATPLIVELIAAAVIALVVVARKPIAHTVRAVVARRHGRRTPQSAKARTSP